MVSPAPELDRASEPSSAPRHEPRSYTVLVCHFGDPFWIRHTLDQVDRLSDSRVEEVVVVDQSRGSTSWLRELPRVREVLTFPPDDRQVALLGHDHPAALDRAVEILATASTTHLLVLDSDCFPVQPGWLDRVGDVMVAADPRFWGLAHPCFMSFPTELSGVVRFDAGLEEVGIDTGRLVGLQLSQAGRQVEFARPNGRAFGGRRGYWYLGGSLYHHGSASFAASKDARLTQQIRVSDEAAFRRALERGTYELDRLHRVRFALSRRLRVARGRATRFTLHSDRP